MYGPTTGPPMSGWTFQVPPSWPAPPEGWTPPPGWKPRPEWPSPPAGWTFWLAPGASVLPSQQSRVEIASAARPPVSSVPPPGQPRYAPPAASVPPPGQPRYAPPAPSVPPPGQARYAPPAPSVPPPGQARYAPPAPSVPPPGQPRYAPPRPPRPAQPGPSGFAAPRGPAPAYAGFPGPVPAAAGHTSHSAPVPHGERVGRLVFIYIGIVVGWVVLGLVLARMFRVHVNPAEYSTEEAYRAAWDRAVLNAYLSVRGITALLNLVLFGVLAQRAGFGGKSSLLLLVPVIGLVVAIRVLWRWTDIEHWERTVGYPGRSYFRWDRPNMTLRQS